MPPPPCRCSPPLTPLSDLTLPSCHITRPPSLRPPRAFPHPSYRLPSPSFNPLPKADDLAQEMEDVDFEEEEEEEGNEEGWVLEPQEGVIGSMEGPDDSEVTFALHSGRSLTRSIINSVQVGI